MSQNVTNCPACSRPTPTARAICQYCGALLPVAEIQTAPSQRQIEPFEHAFNTILIASQSPVPEMVSARFASALGIELELATAMIAAGKPLPLYRSQTLHEAELVAALVRSCGLDATVVPDDQLSLGTALPRARHIRLVDGVLAITYSGASRSVDFRSSSLRLIVVGSLKSQRTDYSEAAAGLGGKTNVMDSYEYHSDGLVLDMYGDNLAESFRILSDGFDYSGLIQPVSFRAEVNFKAALDSFKKAAAPEPLVDSDFVRVRRLLARTWPERTHTESRGIQRAGATLRPVARASVISDNRDQFARYSRLMFLMNRAESLDN